MAEMTKKSIEDQWICW